jgi:hypothetical protein
MMDEEKRIQQMENAEDRDVFPDDQMEEEFHGRESEAMETDEEIRQRESTGRETRENIREREPSAMEKELVPLLDGSEAEEFRSRWLDIQTNFVDDPRHSVENADELVARVINSITENFASERTSLEDQWNRGKEASTEDLRIAIKRYRSFFNRLLTLESLNTEESG